jgi:lipoprotein-releasing system permease protein
MIELFLARRYLLRGSARHISFISIVSCVGIALGVGTLIVVISVMNGFDRDLMERLLRFNYHITVESVDPTRLPDIKAVIDTVPGVKDSSLSIQTQVFAKFDNYVEPIFVKGVDFSNKTEKALFFQYIKEDSGNDGFFVGEGLRRRFFLFSRKLEYYPLEKSFKLKEDTIRGVFQVGVYDIDNKFFIADIEKVKSLSPNYISMLGVRVTNPLEVAQVKRDILEKLPRGLSVSTWIETNKVLFSALQLEKITMFVILSLIILVASFNIFAMLTVKVVEKTKDIGILKALGFTSQKILAIFSLQGLLLGVIGVACGVGLGIGLCVVLQHYPFIKLPEEIYYIEYLPVALNLRDIFLVALGGLCLSFFSTILPALRASRMPGCEALRYE